MQQTVDINQVNLKLESAGKIKRIPVSKVPASISALKDLVKTTFAEDALVKQGAFKMGYTDIDQDLVAISDDDDLSVAY